MFDFHIQTIDELLLRLIEVIDFRLMNEGPSFNYVTEIGMDVTYNRHVANTHSSPLGRKTNFFGRPDRGETGFPGWKGLIAIAFQRTPMKFGSSYFNKTRIYTGTGGHRHRNSVHLLSHRYKISPTISAYEWTTEFYEADFPHMAKQLKIQEMEALLCEEKVDEHEYVFRSCVINPRLELYRRKGNEFNAKKRVSGSFG